MPLKYRYLIIIILVLILGVSAYAFYSSLGIDPPPDNPETEAGQENWIRAKGRINILLLGTDQDLKTNSRTDTIILTSIDTVNKKVSLLSIPRDTRVNIPGFGENKINSANLLGGVDLVKESISGLIKVPIDYYVITNFEGFKGIVDTLGGVEIDVERNMKYRVYDGMIDLKKGLQRLDGEKALQYVRFRHDKLGDITRTQRQQKFLAALAKEMMQAKTILKLPVLIPKLNEAVNTDLSITQMIGLAKEFSNYDLSTITVQTLPGNFVDLNGASYWYVDEEKSHQVVMEVFAGKSTDIIDENIRIGSNSKPKETVPENSKPLNPDKENRGNTPPVPQENSPVIVDPIVPIDNPPVVIIEPTPPEPSTEPTPSEENLEEDEVISTPEEDVTSEEDGGEDSLPEEEDHPPVMPTE